MKGSCDFIKIHKLPFNELNNSRSKALVARYEIIVSCDNKTRKSFIIEAITLLLESLASPLSAICKILIEILPAFMELKEMLPYCTPQNALALFLGIPTIAITLGYLGAKWIVKSVRR